MKNTIICPIRSYVTSRINFLSDIGSNRLKVPVLPFRNVSLFLRYHFFSRRYRSMKFTTLERWLQHGKNKKNSLKNKRNLLLCFLGYSIGGYKSRALEEKFHPGSSVSRLERRQVDCLNVAVEVYFWLLG